MALLRATLARLAIYEWVVLAVVGLSVVLGGGDMLAPLAEAALQVLTAVLSVVWLWSVPAERLRAVPFAVWWIVGALILLPALQLIPLSPSVWHGLGGRDVEQGALQLVGQQNSWRPLSIVPYRTLASLLVMAHAAIVLVMVSTTRRFARAVMLAQIVALALISVMLGAAQMAGGDDNPFRFYRADVDFLVGFQRGHNAEADLLLIALLCLAACTRELFAAGLVRARAATTLVGVVMVDLVLATGIVLSASRSGMTMMIVAFIGQVLILSPLVKASRARLIALGTVIFAGIAVLGVVVWGNARLVSAVHRFSIETELRPEIWRNTLDAMHLYFPWGAGMGSFMPAFNAMEPLDMVGHYYIDHAHNDYLEFILESGVLGIVIAVTVLIIMAYSAFRLWKRLPSQDRAPFYCAALALCIIGTHSFLDYPLRSMSLDCIAAVCAALVVGRPKSASSSDKARDRL